MIDIDWLYIKKVNSRMSKPYKPLNFDDEYVMNKKLIR